ncbi:HAMP domain-containing histidine kinase [Desulfoprunum benzoelyticum]|uniref:histidine kinase n=1 Tax=Desulfoprunum benzoelyticum TaxID=1506996 RepID=A0A840V1Y6_9BACT|nr:HAMP domain-containing histidine kinase [Desulfoprunum benzoelyticum]MBB5348858.1 signal transduction histidine kinase [Desulfoprunum benzoelyticum]MBM9530098.1 HAMP domain-containing histidine kinase [Desulfoprunum benzoelyticum]
MTVQYDSIGGSGLQFFGTVSASISHELKNVLAIINENAGLLEDLTFAARRGSPIDPDKLDRTVQNFSKQIHRADEILKNMNRFAHSVDQFESQIDLHDLVVLVANLAARKAAMGRISLATTAPAQPIHLTCNPFLLENLVWLCLELAIAATGAGRTLTLIPEKTASTILLHITGIDGLSETLPVPDETGFEAIRAALGATMTTDPAGHTLTLHLA